MLANNNRPVINRLAKNTIRTNRRQFSILFVTIMLSAFMLFSVFTTGLTYLDLSRLQNTRIYGSEYDAAVLNGFTEKQRENLISQSRVETVGVLAYCGRIRSSDIDSTVNSAMLWGDKVYWESQKASAITEMKGHYPQAENELLATKEALKECGKSSLAVGDSLSVTYENNTGIHTKKFVISGIWKGYGGDRANFYVSEAFYRQTGYDLESDGILQIKFKSNYVTKKAIKKTEESLELSSAQTFQSSDYIDKSLTILLAVLGLGIIICLSAYLLIYNILYLSVSGKIRYYGLLQTLGMTKKQLIEFIRRQILTAGAAGIIAGVASGIAVSLVFIPYIMKALGISLGNTGLCFYPEVLILTVLVTGIALLCGVRTPVRIAADVTPVEAAKYRENIEISNVKKKGKGNLYWRMAKDQLKKNKKRTAVVFLSLAASLMVFFCLTTLIDSQGKRTIYPNYWDADFIVHNDTQTMEDMTSLRPAIDDKFVSDIQAVEGAAEVHAVKGVPVVFPYDKNGFSGFWIKGYTELKPYLSYPEAVSEYEQKPEKYYGMIKGIDEAEFDYLNESLGNAVDRQDFLNGQTAVVQYAGFEIPEEWIGRTVSFSIGNRLRKITIGAVSYGDYYGATADCGANLIVSEAYAEAVAADPYVLSLNIKYKKSYDEDTEKKIKEIVEASPCSNDLLCISKYDDMKTIQASASGMFEIGTAISLLLLLVGMLNYINTMAGSIQNRKLTFSIMESVGMSGKQTKKLLICEGLLYAGGSVAITLTFGTCITYFIFQSMNYMKISFTIPVLPLVCAILLVTIICVLTPIASYMRTVRNSSVAERLREYE